MPHLPRCLATATMELLILHAATAATSAENRTPPIGVVPGARQQQTCALATERMTAGANALRNHFWNESTGLWEQNLWWHQANSLEVLASHAILDPDNETLRTQVEEDIQHMFQQNNNMSRGGPFLTGYFDDEEWWALGWLRAWELTGNHGYVERTNIIHQHQVDMAWNDSSCGGGLMWQGTIYSENNRTGNPYKGAITNELFLVISAKMALLGPEDTRAEYLEWTERIWEWFWDTGMINAHWLVNDGLDEFAGHNAICANNNQTEWTYNQGLAPSSLPLLILPSLRRFPWVPCFYLRAHAWSRRTARGSGLLLGTGAGKCRVAGNRLAHH